MFAITLHPGRYLLVYDDGYNLHILFYWLYRLWTLEYWDVIHNFDSNHVYYQTRILSYIDFTGKTQGNHSNLENRATY